MAGSYVHLETQERALIETQLTLGMRPAVTCSRPLSRLIRGHWLSRFDTLFVAIPDMLIRCATNCRCGLGKDYD